MLRVLITGSSQCIALGIAPLLLARGDRVWFGCRRPEVVAQRLAQIADQLGLQSDDHRDRLNVVALNVASRESIDAARDFVGRQSESLDLLIQNAGVYEVGHGTEPFGRLTFGDSEEFFRYNSIGPLLVAQAFFDLLRAGNQSKIVTICSGGSSLSKNNGGGPYQFKASYAALNMYMRSLVGDARRAGMICATLSLGFFHRNDVDPAKAKLSSEEHAIRIIDGLVMKDCGRFLDGVGRDLPW